MLIFSSFQPTLAEYDAVCRALKELQDVRQSQHEGSEGPGGPQSGGLQDQPEAQQDPRGDLGVVRRRAPRHARGRPLAP